VKSFTKTTLVLGSRGFEYIPDKYYVHITKLTKHMDNLVDNICTFV